MAARPNGSCSFKTSVIMRHHWLSFCLLLSLLSGSVGHGAETPSAVLDDRHRTFFKDYCVECHNEKKQRGKLRLDDISFALDSVENADRWQKILNQINSGEMPPEESKQPEREGKTEFLDSLSHTLMAARRFLGDSGGKITMRRLNRREYKNTVRDLLGVEMDLRELPADGGAGMFDTVGSSLFMSSDQFEQYLAIGRQALDEHFARMMPLGAQRGPLTFKTRIETEVLANKEMAAQLEALKKAHERYLQWTAAVDAEASKPESTALVGELRQHPTVKANGDQFYIQWAKHRDKPSPKQFGFQEADLALFFGKLGFERGRHLSEYLAMPHKDSGSYLHPYNGHEFEKITVDTKWPAGTYTLRVQIAALDDAPSERRFIQFGQHGDNISIFTILGTYQVTGTMARPQLIEIPVTVTSNGKREFVIREKKSSDRAVLSAQWWEAFNKTGVGTRPSLWIDYLEIEGPVSGHTVAPTPPHQAVRKRVEPETEANRRISDLRARLEKRFESFKQWSTAMDVFADKPENQEATARFARDFNGWRRPIAYYQGVGALSGAPAAKTFGFTDLSAAIFDGADTFHNDHPYLSDYLNLPNRDSGSYLTMFKANPKELITADADWPVGRYLLRIRAAAVDGSKPERRFLEVGHPDPGVRSGPMDDSGTISVLTAVQVSGTIAQPQVIEIPVEVTLNGPRQFVLREKRPNSVDAAVEIWREHLSRDKTGPRPAIWIDWMELEGPVGGGTPAPAASKTIRQRREVELHANAMVGGTYNGYFKGGYEAAKAYFETGLPQKGIPDELEAKFRIRSFEEHGPSFERYLNDPLTKTGAYLTIKTVHTEELISLPPDQPSGWLKTKHEVEKVEPGEYLLRFRIGAVEGTPKERHFLALGSRVAGAEDFTLMQTFQISGTTEAPQVIEVPVSISANGPRTFVLREKRDVKLDGELYEAARKETRVGPPSALWIDWVEWEGPQEATDKLVAAQPVLFANTSDADEHDHARDIIHRFAIRAFRGKEAAPAFIDKCTALFDARRRAGDAFEVAIRTPLSVVLASPGFLYLAEPAETGKPGRISSLELASRLSYFLWSAPPDDQLLKAEFSKPGVVSREVDRMIASPKADAFVSGFVHQWLGMDRLDFFQFDTKQFRDFDESAKAAARREVYETFAHLLRNDGSLTKLLKSDEIHVNGLLAAYYGIEGVSGDAFQKVKLPADSPRGGLLGMAAVLAMGSNGERTSPVERGAWVLRKLLHSPPPPAPPNVPQITRLENKLLTTRERLLAHQEEPQCLQCHRKIDPIGFGLENFNAAGKWRTEETYEKRGVGKKTWPINPSGSLHNGPAFEDYFQLREVLASTPETFARGFAEALIEYALGRPYGFTDEALANGIVSVAKAKNYALREFIVALASSREFGLK